jgi:hypothetical protein
MTEVQEALEISKQIDAIVKTPEIKIIKITSPTWVGYLAEPIKEFVNKIKTPTIRYETLYTYLVNVVQYGGSTSELWVAHYENDYKPIAFANWYVKGLPHVGAAEIGFIHSWNRAKVPVGLLLDQFLKFSYENRCTIYVGDLVNEVVWKVFEKAAADRGIQLTRTEQINFYGKKVN